MAFYKDIKPKFGSNGQIGYTASEDLEAVKNALKNLFLIKKGEVPGKPWLGSPLTIFLFDNIGFFEQQSIRTSFINTVENYEPRVQVVNLTVEGSPEYNSLTVNLDYYVYYESKNIQQNLRFSLSHNEMTNIDLRKTQGVTSG